MSGWESPWAWASAWASAWESESGRRRSRRCRGGSRPCGVGVGVPSGWSRSRSSSDRVGPVGVGVAVADRRRLALSRRRSGDRRRADGGGRDDCEDGEGGDREDRARAKRRHDDSRSGDASGRRARLPSEPARLGAHHRPADSGRSMGRGAAGRAARTLVRCLPSSTSPRTCSRGSTIRAGSAHRAGRAGPRPRELKGTILLAEEGINLFLAGDAVPVRAVRRRAARRPAVRGAREPGRAGRARQPFRKMLVKVKREIIRMDHPTIRPERRTGAGDRTGDAAALARSGSRRRRSRGRDARHAQRVRGRLRHRSTGRSTGASSGSREFPDAARRSAAPSCRARRSSATAPAASAARRRRSTCARRGSTRLQLDGGILGYFEAGRRRPLDGGVLRLRRARGAGPRSRADPDDRHRHDVRGRVRR